MPPPSGSPDIDLIVSFIETWAGLALGLTRQADEAARRPGWAHSWNRSRELSGRAAEWFARALSAALTAPEGARSEGPVAAAVRNHAIPDQLHRLVIFLPRPEQRLAVAELLARWEPEALPVLLLVANCLHQVGRLDDAVTRYLMALDTSPGSGPALLGLRAAQQERGDPDLATSQEELRARVTEGESPTPYERACLEGVLGGPLAALEHLRAAVTGPPAAPEALARAGVDATLTAVRAAPGFKQLVEELEAASRVHPVAPAADPADGRIGDEFPHAFFFSYTAVDRFHVEPVAARLRARNIPVWAHQAEQHTGSDRAFREGLRTSRDFVLWVSAEYLESDACDRERATCLWTSARAPGARRVLAVVLDGSAPGSGLPEPPDRRHWTRSGPRGSPLTEIDELIGWLLERSRRE
jgi:hypothetical protein